MSDQENRILEMFDRMKKDAPVDEQAAAILTLAVVLAEFPGGRLNVWIDNAGNVGER